MKYFLLTFSMTFIILLSSCSLFFPEYVQTVPVRTISIDGDSFDWFGISPLIFDETGDHNQLEGYRGTDLKAAYITLDSEKVYWRIDYANGNPNSLANYRVEIPLHGDYITPSEFYTMEIRLQGNPEGIIEHRMYIGTWNSATDTGTNISLHENIGQFEFGDGFFEAEFPRSLIEPYCSINKDYRLNAWIVIDGLAKFDIYSLNWEQPAHINFPW